MKKLLLIAALFPFVCSAQIYKNWATSNAVPRVPSFAITATSGTNRSEYASNQFGVFHVPYWDVTSFADRAQFLDHSNFVIMEIRHSGVQPNGMDEGTFNNVIYFGGQEHFDAFSFNFPDIVDNGRLTFIFNDEAYQWRWRNNRLAIDPGSGGTDQYLIFRHDNPSGPGGNIWFGDTNLITHLLGSKLVTDSVGLEFKSLVTNIWSGTSHTQLVLNLDLGSLTVFATNGFSMTNFVGLESGWGTYEKTLRVDVLGCTNTASVIDLPLFGPSYGVMVRTNTNIPGNSVTNGLLYRYVWVAKGTNLTLTSTAWQ